MKHLNLKAALLVLADDEKPKPAAKNIFDKYREIQRSYKKLLQVIEASKDDPDPTLKKFETQARDRVQKLGADIKASIAKLENNAFVEPKFKAKVTALMDEAKAKFKGMKYQLTGQKVVVLEDKRDGLAVCHIVSAKVSGPGKDFFPVFCLPEYSENPRLNDNVYDFFLRDEDGQKLKTDKVALSAWLSSGRRNMEITTVAEILIKAGYVASDDKLGTMAEAKRLLSTLRFRGEVSSDSVSIETPTSISRGFRVYDFFEGRMGVEDDDDPNFEGIGEATKQIERHFSGILSKIYIKLRPDEKAWFTVYIGLK